MTDRTQYCTFALADLLLGVEVRRVQEVVRPQELTRVPLAPPDIRGLINLRGQIVTAVDLRRRLGLPDGPPDRRPMNVVLRRDDTPTSLLVDAIGDVTEADAAAFERPPETLTGPARELVRGAFKLPAGLLLVLDIDKLLATAA